MNQVDDIIRSFNDGRLLCFQLKPHFELAELEKEGHDWVGETMRVFELSKGDNKKVHVTLSTFFDGPEHSARHLADVMVNIADRYVYDEAADDQDPGNEEAERSPLRYMLRVFSAEIERLLSADNQANQKVIS